LLIRDRCEFASQDRGIARERARLVPVGRVGEPEELAATILFLTSDRASYISGQDILVDGALSQTLMTFIPRPGSESRDSVASA
jgi:NAD(P)-dependent dehydrogenase (short-subunit alcohol dehydrogenase family)